MQPLPIVNMYKLERYAMPPLTTHDTTWGLHPQHAACSMQSHHQNAHEAWHGPTKMNTNTKHTIEIPTKRPTYWSNIKWITGGCKTWIYWTNSQLHADASIYHWKSQYLFTMPEAMNQPGRWIQYERNCMEYGKGSLLLTTGGIKGYIIHYTFVYSDEWIIHVAL